VPINWLISYHKSRSKGNCVTCEMRIESMISWLCSTQRYRSDKSDFQLVNQNWKSVYLCQAPVFSKEFLSITSPHWTPRY
jgi:hypothetical protein